MRSKAESRNLRVLVINDDLNVPVAVENVEVIKFDQSDDIVLDRLAGWGQHLGLWARGAVPTFDILLVDIRFHTDQTDPSYSSKSLNPHGLVHALPLVGQLTTSNMPFVWGIHSADKDSILNNPLATFCYGLLKVMEHDFSPCEGLDEEFEKQEWDQDLAEFFRRQFANDEEINTEPDRMIRSLIGKYRNAFVRACGDTLSLDYDQIDEIAQLANDFEHGNLAAGEKLDNASIIVSNGAMKDWISVRSFFADVPKWTPAQIRQIVIPQIQALQSTSELTIWPDLLACIRAIEADQESDSDLAKSAAAVVKSQTGNRKKTQGRLRGALVLAACLKLLHRQWRTEGRYDPPAFETSEVNMELGYLPNDFQWANRQLKPICGKTRMTTFRDELDQVPLRLADLRECGSRYWDILNETYGSKLRLPACLVDPESYYGVSSKR